MATTRNLDTVPDPSSRVFNLYHADQTVPDKVEEVPSEDDETETVQEQEPCFSQMD
jgi:hypothetical protein